MNKVIEVTNLVKKYSSNKPKSEEKEFTAVNNISFFVEKGEIFGILGPNGAGKTTTLEIIEGLKHQTTGEVKVLGLDNLKNIKEIKTRIGVQLQESGFLHNLNCKELLELFASFYNLKIDAKEILASLNLEEKINAYPKELSGGQRQRFSIALALVNKPEILFLDEPTTGLDPSARRSLWQLIKKINAQGITIVLTTHYMEEAEFLCHRVGIMDSGKILEIESPAKLIDNLSKTTQISFLTSEKISDEVLKKLPNVVKIYNHFPKIILEINSLDHVGQVPKILQENNIAFFGFTLKTASLEDVYLDLTGKEYEE